MNWLFPRFLNYLVRLRTNFRRILFLLILLLILQRTVSAAIVNAVQVYFMQSVAQFDTDNEGVFWLEWIATGHEVELRSETRAKSRSFNSVLELAVQAVPSSERIRLLGQMRLVQGDLEGAVAAFERRSALKVKDGLLLEFYLGIAHELLDRHESAVRVWRQTPEIVRFFLANGIKRFRGNDDTAIWYLSVASELDPTQCVSRYYLGLAWERADRPQRALSSWADTAIVHCTDSEFQGEIYFRRGRLHAELGNTDAAIGDLRRSVALRPNDIKRMILLANTLLSQDDPALLEEAISLFKRSLQIDPQEMWAYTGLCRAERTRQDYSEAFSWCRKAVSRFPERAHTHHQLGMLQMAVGRTSSAIASFERAVSVPGANAIMWIQLGDLYRGSGRIDRARSAYEQALQLDERNVSARQRLENMTEE